MSKTEGNREQELIDAFLAGEQESHQRVQRWADAVVRGGRWGFEDPEGVRQEILAKLVALLRAGAFRHRSSFKTWVYSVAKYSCIDAFRNQRVRRRIEVDEDVTRYPSGEARSPEARVLARERRNMMDFILQQLPEECLQLWDWVYKEGLSARDVASRLGINEGTVRVRVHRCLKRAQEIRSRSTILPELATVASNRGQS